MTKGKLNELTDLSHLLAAATNVVVADLVQASLLLLALYRVTLWIACQKAPMQRAETHIPVWMTVSCATIQYSAGSVSMTLNSTVRIPPRTKKVSPLRTGRYAISIMNEHPEIQKKNPREIIKATNLQGSRA